MTKYSPFYPNKKDLDPNSIHARMQRGESIPAWRPPTLSEPLPLDFEPGQLEHLRSIMESA